MRVLRIGNSFVELFRAVNHEAEQRAVESPLPSDCNAEARGSRYLGKRFAVAGCFSGP